MSKYTDDDIRNMKKVGVEEQPVTYRFCNSQRRTGPRIF